MKEKIIKRLKGLSWHSIMMVIPFVLGFLSDQRIKDLIEKYPKELGFLVIIGLVLGQISKYYTNYLAYKAELAKFQ